MTTEQAGHNDLYGGLEGCDIVFSGPSCKIIICHVGSCKPSEIRHQKSELFYNSTFTSIKSIIVLYSDNNVFLVLPNNKNQFELYDSVTSTILPLYIYETCLVV